MKALVILCGSGHRDGSEIHEAVFTLAALEECGAEMTIAAPNDLQSGTTNHCNGLAASGASRNMLEESARIARGQIVPLSEVAAESFDALFFPGGFGVARNLCNFAEAGEDMQVRQYISDLIRNFYRLGKPMGFICIAPVLAAKVLSEFSPVLTSGNSNDVAGVMERWGATHQICEKGGCLVDQKAKIVSTPAYMYGDSKMAEVSRGIEKLVEAVQRMIR